MSEPTIIYVVQAGEYSDCHIVGCFTDPELAAACVRMLPEGGVTDIVSESTRLNQAKIKVEIGSNRSR